MRIRMVFAGALALLICTMFSDDAVADRALPRISNGERDFVRSQVNDGLRMLKDERYPRCYGVFAKLYVEQDVKAAVEDVETGDRERLSSLHLDILWGLAKCADAFASLIDDETQRIEALALTIEAYENYARCEHRSAKVHRPRIAFAGKRSGELYDPWQQLIDGARLRETQEVAARPGNREPISQHNRLDPQSLSERTRAAMNLLASGYYRISRETFLMLQREPDGAKHPDVLWGIAQSTELLCASVDAPQERIEFLRSAMSWYTQYLDVEQRPDRRHLAQRDNSDDAGRSDTRYRAAERALRQITQRIAALEIQRDAQADDSVARNAESGNDAQQVGVPSVSSEADAMPENQLQNATLASAQQSVPEDESDDSATRSVVDPVELSMQSNPPEAQLDVRVDDAVAEARARAELNQSAPGLAQFVETRPEYTMQLALCYVLNNMAKRHFVMEREGLYAVYDLPTPDTPCPPQALAFEAGSTRRRR